MLLTRGQYFASKLLLLIQKIASSGTILLIKHVLIIWAISYQKIEQRLPQPRDIDIYTLKTFFYNLARSSYDPS